MADAALFTATLDDFPLEIETLDDQFEKAIARYEIPYRQGAILEDLGQKARTVRIRCHFWDDGAGHETYAAHIDFVKHLAATSLSSLVHPQYGPLRGCIESVAVRHDDKIRAAEVDVNFVEDSSTGVTEPSYAVSDVAADAEGAFVDSIDQVQASVIAAAAAALGTESRATVEKQLNPELSILEQLPGISQAARRYVASIDSFISGLNNELPGVSNPTTSLTATMTFASTLPGRLIGALFVCLDRYAARYASLSNAPDRYLDSFRQAALGLETRLGFPAQVRPAAAGHAAVLLGDMLTADEQARKLAKASEQTPSFDALGNYSPPPAGTAVMPVDRLESCLATLNMMVQSAIDADRSQEALKQLSRRQQDYITTIKLEREKIRVVTVDNPQPLHLVCLAYGLPYTQAPRIQSINRIPAPNFTRGEVSIYVR